MHAMSSQVLQKCRVYQSNFDWFNAKLIWLNWSCSCSCKWCSPITDPGSSLASRWSPSVLVTWSRSHGRLFAGTFRIWSISLILWMGKSPAQGATFILVWMQLAASKPTAQTWVSSARRASLTVGNGWRGITQIQWESTEAMMPPSPTWCCGCRHLSLRLVSLSRWRVSTYLNLLPAVIRQLRCNRYLLAVAVCVSNTRYFIQALF